MKFLKLRNIIISFSFLLTAIVLCVDNQPQQFPLSDDFETPDCLNIRIVNISNDFNRIKISMYADQPFIEFPIESASNLIKVTTETSTSFFSYIFNDFWDYNVSYRKDTILKYKFNKNDDFNRFYFDFNILQTIYGNVSVSVFCNKIKIGKNENEKRINIQENPNYSENERKNIANLNQKYITDFNFSIDEIRYYPVGWSKIELFEMGTLKVFGFSIFKSNFIFHSTTFAQIKPFRFGSSNYNVSIDIRNCASFCNYSNESYYSDTVFLVSFQSLNELKPQIFIKNCILRIYFLMLTINNHNSPSVTSNYTSEGTSKYSNSLSNDQKEMSTCPIKLLIVNDNKIENVPIIRSNEKYQCFENMFGPKSIEIINMNDKKCFREGLIIPLENNTSDYYLNDDLFLSNINNSLFNISLLKNKFICKNNTMKINTLIDSVNIAQNPDWVLLNISNNTTELINTIYSSETLIISKNENLPFALFMHEGANLILVKGNKLIGQKISNLSKLSSFQYYNDFSHFEAKYK